MYLILTKYNFESNALNLSLPLESNGIWVPMCAEAGKGISIGLSKENAGKPRALTAGSPAFGGTM